MSSFADYLEDALLNHVFRNTALASPTNVFVSLHTSPGPSDAGPANEVTGSGYARQQATFGAPSGGIIQNTAQIEFTASGGNFGDVIAVGVFDAATGGNMLSWDDFTATTINDGDTLRIAVGQLSISLT